MLPLATTRVVDLHARTFILPLGTETNLRAAGLCFHASKDMGQVTLEEGK